MAKRPEPRLIKIGTAFKEGRIQIAVEDNGPGVPAGFESRILRAVFHDQGSGRWDRAWVVHRARHHERARRAHSLSALVPGGAAFVLDLPILSVESEGIRNGNHPRSRRDRLPDGARSEKILVVDDEKAIGEMLGEMLSLLGFTASLCVAAADALKVIGQRRFDVVFSDVRMPEIDGPQFYRLAVEKVPRLGSRFIFLTGDTVNEDTRTFLRKAGRPFLAKPFRLANIQDVVGQVLQPLEG